MVEKVTSKTNQNTNFKDSKSIVVKETLKEFSLDKEFDYLLVLDFEATCQDKEDKSVPKMKVYEIIEFPVLVIDVKKQEVINKFHYYIKPDIHPVLTTYCTELTGIEQKTVDSGISLLECMKKLESFLAENKILESNFSFITCGDWDLKTCLRNELKYKGVLQYPNYLKQWVNVKFNFYDYMNWSEQTTGMPGMLKRLGLTLEGRHHSGIDDCKNIAKIVISLLKKKVSFTKRVCRFVPK